MEFDERNDPTPNRLTSTGDERMVGILEAQLGLERCWQLRNCWTGIVRFGGEAQYWMNGGSPNRITMGEDDVDANGPDPRAGDFGLVGFNLEFGLMR